MENLSSAAAQGEQAFEPHHANGFGYNFTGADPNVRTLEDAVRHGQTYSSGRVVVFLSAPHAMHAGLMAFRPTCTVWIE